VIASYTYMRGGSGTVKQHTWGSKPDILFL